MITIAYSTREYNSDYDKHILDTCGLNIDEIEILTYVNDGSKSLTTIYNDVLKNATNDKIILIHDDLEFLTKDWGKIVLDLFERYTEYGVIGIAGSAYFDSEAMWWKYQNIYGQVYHTDGAKVWCSKFSNSLKDKLKEVVVIDGLFMAIDRTKIKKDFNESLTGFHFYDIDFCLRNYLTEETKIGVTTLIQLIHKFVGKLNNEWLLNKIKINNTYGIHYPIK